MAEPSRSTGIKYSDFAAMFSQGGAGGNNPVPQPNSQTTKKMYPCSQCHELVPKTLLCGRCKEIRYCSKECQKAHWGVHKVFCRAPGEQSLCGNCDKLDAKSLCGRCQDIKYCDEDCGKAHWEIHKAFCLNPETRTPITAADLHKASLNGQIPPCIMSPRIRRESDITLTGRNLIAAHQALVKQLDFSPKK